MKSKHSKKPTPTPAKPNGREQAEHIPRNELQLMSAARFRHSVALAIDQHAVAIADLDMQLQATKSFMADLSERVQTVHRHVAALDAWQREQIEKTLRDAGLMGDVEEHLREMNQRYDEKFVEQQQAEQTKEP